MSIYSGQIYILENKAVSGLVLQLRNKASTSNDTLCEGSIETSDTIDTFYQQWLISTIEGRPSNIFTMRNLRSGTFVDLENGSQAEGTLIHGHSAQPEGSEKNQQWLLSSPSSDTAHPATEPPKFYTIINVASGTYLTLDNASGTNGTKVKAYKHSGADTQLWQLHRVSRTGAEIEEFVKKIPNKDPACKVVNADRVYITLRKRLRDKIGYADTILSKINQRPKLFDREDYVFVTKAAVSKWANAYFRADGFTVLWGILYGKTEAGTVEAYNWHLNTDLTGVALFDPVNGQDSEKPNIRTTMVVF